LTKTAGHRTSKTIEETTKDKTGKKIKTRSREGSIVSSMGRTKDILSGIAQMQKKLKKG
jgi:hypothetical protein